MKRRYSTSIRMKGYDYTRRGRYFVTIVVRNRQRLFERIVDGVMHLNEFGQIAQQEWLATLKKRKGRDASRPNERDASMGRNALRPIELGEAVIMPDHVHLIVSIVYPKEQTKYNPNELDRRAGAVAGKDICKEGSLGSIVRGYKAAVTNQIKGLVYSRLDQKGLDASRPDIDLKKSIWQRNYHDIIIRTDRAYNNITNYIKNYPRKWEEDLIKKLNKDD
ncbi:MAG: hypothetical protein WBA16_04290 [Nonlabens sp.]